MDNAREFRRFLYDMSDTAHKRVTENMHLEYLGIIRKIMYVSYRNGIKESELSPLDIL